MRCRVLGAVLSLASLAAACTPYAVSTTAVPLARGEVQRTATLTVVPRGAQWSYESAAQRDNIAMPGIDMEQRVGLDDRSDVGIRIPTFSGVIVSYKRRLNGPSDLDAPATAIMVGAGLVNYAQHAHGDLTLITSGRESALLVPYGGFRVIQILPLGSLAVRDTPAVGAFTGLKMGGRTPGVSAELGVFYDRSALGLRRSTVIVVPSIAVHGNVFRRLLRRQRVLPRQREAKRGAILDR